MADKKFFIDVDLNRNQLMKAVIENEATASMAALLTTAGQIGYDTDTNQIKYSGGTDINYLLDNEDFTGDFSGNTTSEVKMATIKSIYDYYSSTDTGEGAARIGIEDSEDHFTSTDVEGALDEIGDALDGIGDSMEIVGIIGADNTDRTYPTTTDATKADYSVIAAGDAFLVTGNTVGDFYDDANTYVQMGAHSWIGTGAIIVARVSGATDSDADWFVLDANREFTSEAAAGIVALATQAEVNTGTNDTKTITPLKLKAFIEHLSGTTMFWEEVSEPITTPRTVTHGMGDNVTSQVWLSGEDITSGVKLTQANDTVTVEANSDPGDIKVVVIGTTQYPS